MKKAIYLILMLFIVSACKEKNRSFDYKKPTTTVYDPSSISHLNPLKTIKGQTLYLPIYSSIPYHEGVNKYSLSGFAAIHNTDLNHSISLINILYLNNDGQLVKDFLNGKHIELKPMATTNFFIPESDTSGVGANFIIEWQCDSLVNEPLIESVMVSLNSGQGVSFTSQAKVINEIR